MHLLHLYASLKSHLTGLFSFCTADITASRCSLLLLIPFFSLHLLLNEGKLPLAGTLPPVEMAFLVRCYANCLQPWSSKVSDVVIPFLDRAAGLGWGVCVSGVRKRKREGVDERK